MMWINGFFVLCNALLMYVADYPTVNFMCALISLLGFSASYVMYKTQS
jgi:Ni,Fe-hydrogenase I cytochrome b subunit